MHMHTLEIKTLLHFLELFALMHWWREFQSFRVFDESIDGGKEKEKHCIWRWRRKYRKVFNAFQWVLWNHWKAKLFDFLKWFFRDEISSELISPIHVTCTQKKNNLLTMHPKALAKSSITTVCSDFYNGGGDLRANNVFFRSRYNV